MYHRLKGLFFRYISTRVIAERAGSTLRDSDDYVVGAVEHISVTGNRLVVTGWAATPRVVLENDIAQAEAICDVPDFLQDAPATPTYPFEIDVPLGGTPARLRVDGALMTEGFVIDGFHRGELRRGYLNHGTIFAWRVVKTLPLYIKWRRDTASVTSFDLKSSLGLIVEDRPKIVNQELIHPATPTPIPTGTRIRIILPVFNGFRFLPETLDRIERHTDLPWHLVVIEDCSTDPQVRPYLAQWAATRAGRVHLILNEENLGFPKSVNKGLATASEGEHAVLLNSDARVPADWASRLIAPIVRNPDVASVTPFSNDAELFSVPLICESTTLETGGDEIDALARKYVAPDIKVMLPTGTGFCMALNARFLQKIPTLDEVFGRGYGEEVDWCQKASALGGVHAVAGNLFVQHLGAGSFGAPEKQALTRAGDDVITRRYPRYNQQVQDFIAADALATPRMLLGFALVQAQATSPLPIFIAHSLGGGAENYLQARIRDNDGRAIVLRVGGAHRWTIELHCLGKQSAVHTNDFDDVLSLLEPVSPRTLVYSCGVGDRYPAELPADLIRLKRAGDHFEFCVHDYFAVTPSYCLLDTHGRFSGLPDPSDTGLDPVHGFGLARDSSGTPVSVSLADWQARWAGVLEQADQITVFSDNSAAYIEQAYPMVRHKIKVRPHLVSQDVKAVARPQANRLTIGILGNIAPQKGAAIVSAISASLRDGEGLIVTGQIAPGYTVQPPAIIHGGYQIEDIPAMVKRYGITCWAIPSVWPETFSFATHEALATELPVFVFDLGAQADAARAAKNGHIVPFDPDAPLAEALLAALRDHHAKGLC